jgi:thiol-disulfide isomerase/thioredoxin
MRGFLRNRWLWAALVAIAIVPWPSCAKLGEAAPLDFVLKDMSGKDVRLADLKGRPILLNFWATWCGPCKTEIPWLVEFNEQYKDKQLAIVGISVDDPVEDLKPFVAEHKMTYPVLLGKGHDDLMAAYQASEVIPVSWFIKPDGTVSMKATGIHPRAWFDQQIKALF